eukprot:4087194-Pyramimonas_sp.AAC.1
MPALPASDWSVVRTLQVRYRQRTERHPIHKFDARLEERLGEMRGVRPPWAGEGEGCPTSAALLWMISSASTSARTLSMAAPLGSLLLPLLVLK